MVISMIPRPKRLILINPRVANPILNFVERILTGNPIPSALLTLAGCTPKEYDIKIINQRLFWFPGDFEEHGLIGITCLTNMVSDAYRLADAFRLRGSTVILGGPHVSALPDEALLHADSVVVGEAEGVWAQVLSDYENGALRPVYQGEPLEDFFTPVFDYFMRLDARVLARSSIHIDRGCKYRCDFCARISQWLRTVQMDQVIALINRIVDSHRAGWFRRIFSRPVIVFACDNIYSNPAYAKELFRRLIPLKVAWNANCSIDIGFDDEALRLARAAGCRGFLIGFESIHARDYAKTSAQNMRSSEDYLRAIRNIKKHGFKITGALILGLDSYRLADYPRLLWFIMRAGFWQVILTILTPFPGSPLFERLKQENRIRSFDWRKYSFLTCVIRPKHTSVAAVYFWFVLIRLSSAFFSGKFYADLLTYFVFIASYLFTKYMVRLF